MEFPKRLQSDQCRELETEILDGPFILNEILSWCKAKKKQALVFKVDFEKAYDSVRWDFLDEVLCKFGFGEKWQRWIQACLHSSRGSVIINGSPTEEFQFGKGLKQGEFSVTSVRKFIDDKLHPGGEFKTNWRGQEFNWETATYSKVMYFEDIDYFKDFENEFPAII
nr:RNA-directed DNA polymerase, eukaryota, reverse transcriptase zinc-binding domain protein [Tanacetum cinerariifolium]